MPKNIIFCADGTWNGPGQDQDDDRVADPTNVFKLFANLDGADSAETLRLANEQERSLSGPDGTIEQVAKYLHGVGDSQNFLVKAVGGTGGAGLITRIVRGYTFVSRHFRKGDRIYLVGFSRGAYTVRALGGLIAARGLLDGTQIDLTDKEAAYRLGAAEWFEYRRAALKTRPGFFDRLREVVYDLPGFVMRSPTAPRVTDVPIEAVAVWDTVGALGIPRYDAAAARLDGFQFADTRLSPSVRYGLHAIAVDERRADFTPTLWDTREGVVQVLFPGAHSDVGGGYPARDGHCGLADAALRWMMVELAALHVRFASVPSYALSPSIAGPAHQPWTDFPWTLLPCQDRVLPAGLALHRSLLERLKFGPVPCGSTMAAYTPANLTHYVADGLARPGVVVVPVES